MQIYGIGSCDTCRKALKALEAAGHAPDFTDVRTSPLDRATLDRFHAEFGEALLNRASTTWRTLEESERRGSPVDLIARHPALMKRPVIESGGRLYLGWKDDVRSALLGA